MIDIFASDFTSLQSAFDCAAATGKTLHLTPRATYALASPLTLSNVSVRVDGHGALVYCNVPMRAALELSNGACIYAKGIVFGGGRVADYALYSSGGGGSRFEDCEFYFAIKDGVFLDADSASGGNDCMRFERCKFQHNGREYSIVVNINQTDYPPIPGYATEPIVESPNAQFVTWGARIGDVLNVGSEWMLVQEVIDEAHLKLQLYPGTSGHSNAPATLHIGDGYHEEPFNDNNLVILRDCLFRGNKGNGAKLCGLFGARIQSGQFDFNNAYGIIIGHRNGPVIISSVRDSYFEGNCAPSAILLGAAQGVEIGSVNSDKPITSVTNSVTSWGTAINCQDASGLRQASQNTVASRLPYVP